MTAFLLAFPTFQTGADFGLVTVTRVVLACSADLLDLASLPVLLMVFRVVVGVDWGTNGIVGNFGTRLSATSQIVCIGYSVVISDFASIAVDAKNDEVEDSSSKFRIRLASPAGVFWS